FRNLKKLICRVRPGVRLAYASRVSRANALMALDLPEFERPAKAISPDPAGGNCAIAAAAPSNFAPTSGPAARDLCGAGFPLAEPVDSVTIARFFMQMATRRTGFAVRPGKRGARRTCFGTGALARPSRWGLG